MKYISDVRKFKFSSKIGKHASLFVYEDDKFFPLDSLKRVFIVSAEELVERGNHAHKECSQLLVSISGKVRVTCTDAINQRNFLLDTPNEGLLVPPTIWAQQVYSKGAILMVMTDKLYDAYDYIRDYDEFVQFRRGV